LYWEWTVRKGRHYGKQIPADYIEVHYENLVRDPRQTLVNLGGFLAHDLDYDRIQRTRLGRVGESNSSFREEEQPGESPINRWKEKLPQEEIAALEALIGPALEEFGYTLAFPKSEKAHRSWDSWMHFLYPALLTTKFWLKTRTPVGRMANLSVLELDEAVPQEDTVNV
jgi:hypothetical protein